MYPLPEPFADLQKSQLEALSSFGSTLFNAAERLVSLNLAASRAVFQHAAETTSGLFASKNPQDAFAVAGGAMPPSAERLVGYSRDALSIASGASAELSRIVEARIAEGNRKVAEVIEIAVRNAPAGSDAAASLVKSAFLASSRMFDTLSRAARQATELAEANLAMSADAARAATEAVKLKARKAA